MQVTSWKRSDASGPASGSDAGASMDAAGHWTTPSAQLLTADPAHQHTPAAGIALSAMHAAYENGQPSHLVFLIPSSAAPPGEGPHAVSAAGDATGGASPHLRVHTEHAPTLSTGAHTALEDAAPGGLEVKQPGSTEAGGRGGTGESDEGGKPPGMTSVELADVVWRHRAREGPAMPRVLAAGPSERRRELRALHRELDRFTAGDFFLERFVMGGRLHRRCGGARLASHIGSITHSCIACPQLQSSRLSSYNT